MQLTKDDVETDYEIFCKQADDKEDNGKSKRLDFSKFQQVVEFYNEHKVPDYGEGAFMSNHIDKMKNNPEDKKLRELFDKRYNLSQHWNSWLFDFCFRDGLK